jgi:hypothetical protein
VREKVRLLLFEHQLGLVGFLLGLVVFRIDGAQIGGVVEARLLAFGEKRGGERIVLIDLLVDRIDNVSAQRIKVLLQRLAIDAGLHCEEVTGGLDEHIGAIDLTESLSPLK